VIFANGDDAEAVKRIRSLVMKACIGPSLRLESNF
jgi:hypothetical protein